MVALNFSMNPKRTEATPVSVLGELWGNMPEEMKRLRQWVGALLVWDDEKQKYNKVPKNPMTGRSASPTDPAAWGTFEDACSYACQQTPLGQYIGFVFADSDPYIFIDLDTGKKPETAPLHDWIAQQAQSYTETSLSGAGTHIVVKGSIPFGIKCDVNEIEVYPNGRFMLATGDIKAFGARPIVAAQELLDELETRIGATRTAPAELTVGISDLTDEQLCTKALAADNGHKFLALCKGDWHQFNEYQNDHSRADLALCVFLDFYSKDPEQCIRIFKTTALYRTEKGRASGDGTDYIIRTLKGARARNDNDHPPLPEMGELQARAQQVIMEAQNAKNNTLYGTNEESNNIGMGALEFERTVDGQEAVEQGRQAPQEDGQAQEVVLPPGLVGEIARYIYSSATRPVKEVALMGALAFMGGVAARHFNVPGSGLNMYLILLAPTGCGKEAASTGLDKLMGCIRETVPAVDTFKGPAEFASGQGLVKALNAQSCFFSVLGEFGIRMQQMCDVRAPTSEKALQKALLNMYSKSGWNQTEASTAYSDREKNTKILQAPCLTILGESAPETFFANLTEDHVMSGLLPRFSFLEYKGGRPARNMTTAYHAPSPALVQKCADLATLVLQMEANNTCCLVEPDRDPGARRLLDNFDVYADKKINGGNELFKQLWNRAHLKALRLTALVAVGVDAHSPYVTESIAKWAIDFTLNDINSIATRFEEGDAGSGDERHEKGLQKVVANYLVLSVEKRRFSYKISEKVAEANGVIPYGFLMRKLRALSAFKNHRFGATEAVKRAIQNACEMGLLQKVPPLVTKEQYSCNTELYIIGQNW